MVIQSQESLEMLVMVSRLLSSKLDISELLATIMRLASRVVGAERASLYLLDEKTQELYFDVALGLPKEVQKLRLKLGEGLAGACAQERTSIIMNDVASDDRHAQKVDAKSGFITRSLLTCPMIIKGKAIGVVQAINKIDGDFSETDKNNFEAFASQAAIAIENSRLFSSVKEEKKKMEVVFKKIKEAAILTSPEGEILLLNESAKLFLESEKFKFKNIENALSNFSVTPSFDEIISSDRLINHFEVEREKPKKFFMDGSAIKLITDKEGKNQEIEGWLWILSDITAQKMEACMARNFLSLISHKFKTPLASINGYAQILSDDAASGNATDLTKKAAKTILAQGLKLNELIESLLNFVMIETADNSTLNKTEFGISELFEELIEDIKQKTKTEKDEIINFKLIPSEKIILKADRNFIKIALKSILDNAIKFNPAKEKLVILSSQIKNDSIMLSVGDNGPGIPPEEFKNIFNKFYQVEASFTGQIEGWGIGLSFAKKVADMHNGKILVKSQLEKGSAFTLILPKA
ncbi:MAG: ATP-binding protein [Elusimicrobia bacterium]|nr:ATP-binding protein [Elusimicrobiota bacterium]